MEDNSISAIVTDPPYGLSFMGKGWDHAVPGTEYWEECFRITKPGGYLLCMGGSRTFHRLACAAEDARWKIRDCIMWIYGSGFPKSHNNFGIEGYGTALKPAYEPIIMAMKPLDGTFKQNAEKWGQAGINIDGCRVECESRPLRISGDGSRLNTLYEGGFGGSEAIGETSKGRWPANVILDEEAGKMLDEQSGILKSGKTTNKETEDSIFGKRKMVAQEGSSGGASRFFYCAKASSSERGEYNKHPTVKPLRLMEYLIKLVMPPKDGILLDPFAGSGTTILAAHNLGMKAIGIEKQPEYAEIARARLANASIKQIDPQLDLFDGCA